MTIHPKILVRNGSEKSKGTVSLSNDNNRIRLRWTFQRVRYSLNIFQHSKSNILKAKNIALQIENDMVAGTFDYTLNKYNKYNLPVAQDISNKTIVQIFEEWAKDVRNKDSNVYIDYYAVRQMMKRWGVLNEKTALKNFNLEKIAAKTYNRRLIMLKAFFNWTTKHQFTCLILQISVCQIDMNK